MTSIADIQNFFSNLPASSLERSAIDPDLVRALIPDSVYNNSNSRIVGVYGSIGGDLGIGYGIGGNYVGYIGIDTVTNQVVAGRSYEIEGSVGYSPLDLEAGVFFFNGDPHQLGGSSAYLKGSSVIPSTSASVTTNGHVMVLIGVETDIEVSLGVSATGAIFENGVPIYLSNGVLNPVTSANFIHHFDRFLTVDDAAAYVAIKAGQGITVTEVRATFTDEDGVQYEVRYSFDGESFLEELSGIWKSDERNSFWRKLSEGIDELQRSIIDGSAPFKYCFNRGTLIQLSNYSMKPIESVAVGDFVASYDFVGVPAIGTVTAVHVNTATHLLDVFGLKVTPGHHVLCGDGPYVGRHVPIIDILRTDGALVREDGSLVRAATNFDVGSREDQKIEVAYLESKDDEEHKSAYLRLGSRLPHAEKGAETLLALLEREGAAVVVALTPRSPSGGGRTDGADDGSGGEHAERRDRRCAEAHAGARAGGRSQGDRLRPRDLADDAFADPQTPLHDRRGLANVSVGLYCVGPSASINTSNAE